MGNYDARDQFSPEEVAEARRYALVIKWSAENAAYLAIGPSLPICPASSLMAARPPKRPRWGKRR